MMTTFRQGAIGLALFATPAAAAPQFEDIDALETQLIASLGAGIGEESGPARPLDRRLKLAPCPKPVVTGGDIAGAASLRCEPIGWRIRVPLVASAVEPLRKEKLQPLVRKGDQVEVSAAGGAFIVSTVGVAEQDGAPGDRIRVKAEGKTTRVTGEISADGRVVVAGFK